MPKKITSVIRRIIGWYANLHHRERGLIIFTGICLLATAVYLVIDEVQEYVAETERMLIVRSRDLEELPRLLRRYRTLRGRLEKVQATFAASQLTFEEVTSQLDEIVRESIGSDNYDLKKGGSPTQIGFEYEKQEFTVNVKSLTLEQVTKLLYQLEQGESPLFLGNVDIIMSSRDDTFNATLEIFSIRKS